MNEFDIKELVIIEGDKEFKLYAPKLKAFKQLQVILDIIKIVARGSVSNKLEVEQILNNLFQTGVKVEGADTKIEVPAITLLIDAIKGALANLDDEAFDSLLNKLMVGLTIDDGAGRAIKATREELDNKFTSWKSLLQVMKELIRHNLGFL